MECPPKWTLLKEIIDEIKVDFSRRKLDRPMNDNEPIEVIIKGNGTIEEIKDRKIKEEMNVKCDISSSLPPFIDSGSSTILASSAAASSSFSASASASASTSASLKSLLILKQMSSGCVLVIVKDERTASQLRDFLVHGQVSSYRIFYCLLRIFSK